MRPLDLELQLFSNALKAKHLGLRVICSRSLPEDVFADPNQMRQVLAK